MAVDTAPMLEPARILASRDPEFTRAFMAGKEFHLDLHPRAATAFDFAACPRYFPHSYIGYVRYGSPVSVRVPADRRRDDYFLHFPVRGAASVISHTGEAFCGPRQGVVSSPAGHTMRAEQGSARLTVSLTRSALAEQLAVLLGDAPQSPIEFAPAIDLEAQNGRRIDAQVRQAFNEAARLAPEADLEPLAAHEQLIMTALLLHQPSNYSAALARLEGGVAPGDVGRALDFIQAHLQSPITLAEIVTASGVPGRTLMYHFKKDRGVSPVRYLRAQRLMRVRDLLLRGAEESVTQAAITWGFTHLGRFATDYRKLFGESPSQTRQRRRN